MALSAFDEMGNKFIEAIAYGETLTVREMLLLRPHAVEWEGKADPENSTILLESLPLHTAIRYRRTEIALLLLERGAAFDAIDQQKRTPLSLAAENGLESVVEKLLERGADPELVASPGHNTPLVEAAENGWSSIVKILLRHHAKINVKGAFGWTPLHAAAAAGHRELVRFLIEQGADETQKSLRGDTPAQLAVERKQGKDFPQFIATLVQKRFETRLQTLTDKFRGGAGKTIIAPETATFGRKNHPQHRLSV